MIVEHTVNVPERLQLDLDAGTPVVEMPVVEMPVVEMPVVVHMEWCAYQAHIYELEIRKKK